MKYIINLNFALKIAWNSIGVDIIKKIVRSKHVFCTENKQKIFNFWTSALAVGFMSFDINTETILKGSIINSK